MPVHSIGLTTELGLAATTGRIVHRPEYLVVTMPDEPSYYYGNFLVLPRAPRAGEIERWTRTFAHEIGGDRRIRHVTLRWDGITGDVGAADELGAAGFTIDTDWVMTADELRAATTAYAIRRLRADELAATAELAYACGDRHDDHYRQFLHRRARQRRWLVERDMARWWGAFDGETLVGTLGLVPLGAVARFQDVQTAAAHRGRGIASALLAAAAQGTSARLVIVAAPESAAARLYARAGFKLVERTASACRYPTP